MIVDTVINRNVYSNISSRIKTALDYLATNDFSGMEPGRYEIDGNNLFALVQTYESILKEQGKWECHRNYIDIQYIAEGTEQIGYNNIVNMNVKSEYNPEKDIEILTGDGDYISLTEGFYAIFFPQDAHQPKVAPENKPGQVRKVVIKVKID